MEAQSILQIPEFSGDPEEIISLNVSGTLVKVKYGTLVSVEGSSLQAMFSMRH